MTKPAALLTREQWLNAMAAKCAPLFTEHGASYPAKLRISCGWPCRGALAAKKRRIGECWTPKASKDVTTEIFISPCLDDAARVSDVLVHELVHACVGVEHGHKKPFGKLARAVGLEGKLTATTANPELTQRLNTLCAEVGPYPHAELNSLRSPTKKQGTRMLKLVCPDCGYTCRTTAKWIEQGLPTCCCGTEMERK